MSEPNTELSLDLQHEAANLANDTYGDTLLGDKHLLSTDIGTNILNDQETIVKLQERVAHAQYDSLTGVYERGTWNELVDQMLEFFVRNGDKNDSIVLLNADLDWLREINKYGHQMGNKALEEVAEQLKKLFVRKSDTIGRMGGDEFSIFSLSDHTSLQKIVDWYTKAHASTPTTIKISDEKDVPITQTWGLAILSHEDVEILNEDKSKPLREHIFSIADMALLAAKASGRNCVQSNVTVDQPVLV